ncbi:MAG: cytochrome C oxidase subunit IV family protein [Vicinamibacterales bacterium]
MTAEAHDGNGIYLAVFAALLALTAATVGAALVGSAGPLGVTLGLAIASLKAGLVALYFMHLARERRAVHLTLALTAVFCVGLFALTLLSEADHVPGTRFVPAFDSVTP